MIISNNSDHMHRRRRTLAVLTTVLLPVVSIALAGCSSGDDDHPDRARSSVASPPNEAAIINSASLPQIVDRYRADGLPATEPHDVTAVTCGREHCQAALETDEITLMKFGTTRDAMVDYQSHADAYVVENILVLFAPSVQPDARSRYEHITSRAVE